MAASAPPNPRVTASAAQSWRRAGTGAAALIVGRIVTAACGLIQIRIVLTHLGPAGLGLWIALTGLLWSAGILDGGLGFAVQNRLTTYLAIHDQDGAAALLSHALRRLLLLCAGVLLIGIPVAVWGNWSAWFQVTDPGLRAQLPASLLIVVVGAAVALPLSLSTRIATARQAMWITGGWTAVCAVVGLLAVVAAGALGASLTGFMAAACILPLGPHALTWLHAHSVVHWRAPRDAAQASRLWRDSALFLIPQLGAAVISSLVPTLVTLFAGPIAAATFGVLQRLYGFALQIQTMGLSPTWPAYAHAAAVGDLTFARKTFQASWGLTIVGFILPTLILTPWVPAIIRLWLGAGAPSIPPALLWVTAAWFVLQYCGQPIAMLLNGLGRMESLAATGWAGIALTAGLCALLGPRWGATGIVIALIISYAGLNLPVTGWKARQALTTMRLSGGIVA